MKSEKNQYCYLMGIYNGDKLVSVKIGETADSVYRRRSNLQYNAGKNPTVYNSGKYRVLAYATITNNSKKMEKGVQKFVELTYHMEKFSGAKDHFKPLRVRKTETFIDRFYKGVLYTCMNDDIMLVSFTKKV